MKRILEVPFLSQIDNVSDIDWKEKSCGVVCLAMVIAFYEKKERNIDDFIALGEQVDAYSEEASGWYHHGLCKIANIYGYTAWRRKWYLSEADIAKFTEEGRTKADNDAYNQQALKEGIYSIERSLANDIPVIVSMDKEFCDTKESHLVVVTGVEREGEELKGFYFHNPDTRTAIQQNEYAYLDKFAEHWNKRGIFVIKK